MKRIALALLFTTGLALAAGEYFDIPGTARILQSSDNDPGNAVPIPALLAQGLTKGSLSAEQHELLIGIAATNGCIERALRENMPDPRKHSYQQKRKIVECGIKKVFHCAQQLLITTRLSELNKGDQQDRQSQQQEFLMMLTQLAKQDDCMPGQNVPSSVVSAVKNAN